MTDKFGYIPVYNYIIKIKVFDDIDDVYSGIKKEINNCRYLTSNFQIIQINDYLTDKEIDEIEYFINDSAYTIYGNYSDKSDFKNLIRSYKQNNIYTEKRFYYKTFDRALSETYMRYKLYKKHPNGYSGDYISYYPSGLIKEKYYHINGLIEGKYIRYYNDFNTIEIESEYVNGIKHGLYKQYNGELVDVIENYVMDKLDGLCIYNNFGRSITEYKVEITYKNGIVDGLYKKYYKYKEGGGLHIECNFKDNKYYGIYKEYDMDQNLINECDYKIYNKKIDITDLM
jgi:antitoxin component YwqK of YwqJK toxin-antitoxin module